MYTGYLIFEFGIIPPTVLHYLFFILLNNYAESWKRHSEFSYFGHGHQIVKSWPKIQTRGHDIQSRGHGILSRGHERQSRDHEIITRCHEILTPVN